MRRGRKLLNLRCKAKFSEVNGNSLTGRSWPRGGLLEEYRKKKYAVEAKRLLR